MWPWPPLKPVSKQKQTCISWTEKHAKQTKKKKKKKKKTNLLEFFSVCVDNLSKVAEKKKIKNLFETLPSASQWTGSVDKIQHCVTLLNLLPA